ncbi:MAG: hypothetical protein WCH44_09550 [Betaproteobacteria bacterium]
MNTSHVDTSGSKLPDADMKAVPVALARAAKRAREVATCTGTPLIVAEGGKLVEKVVPPGDEGHRLAHVLKKHRR